MRMKKLLTAAFLFVLAACCVPQAWAQGVTTGSISGLIVDNKGEALPGASVVAVHTSTAGTISPTCGWVGLTR
jgi:hypothetical protein